jgi:hypothetical protein
MSHTFRSMYPERYAPQRERILPWRGSCLLVCVYCCARFLRITTMEASQYAVLVPLKRTLNKGLEWAK